MIGWKQKYRDRKRPMRLRLEMAKLGEDMSKSLINNLLDSEQAAYIELAESEITEVQNILL